MYYAAAVTADPTTWTSTLLSGLKYTLILTFLGMGVALVLALVLVLPQVMHRRIWVLVILVRAIVELVRGTPLILQLFYIFYVFPQFGLQLSPVTAGVIGLGLNYAAYLSEIYRAGIQAVPKGQWEASDALGMSWGLGMRRIILPQAARISLPSIGNYFVSLFKDSALCSTISVTELLFAGQLIASDTFKYLTVYTIILITYFVISYPASLGVRALERHLRLDRPRTDRRARGGRIWSNGPSLKLPSP